MTIAVLQSPLDQVLFYHLDILIGNKNVDLDTQKQDLQYTVAQCSALVLRCAWPYCTSVCVYVCVIMCRWDCMLDMYSFLLGNLSIGCWCPSQTEHYHNTNKILNYFFLEYRIIMGNICTFIPK